MSTLLDLATRCEQATGPTRELDFDIWFMRKDKELLWALSGMNAQRPLWTDGDLETVVRRNPAEYGFGPTYSASLDAAMQLAEGLGGEVTFFRDGTAKAFIWQPYPFAIEAKAATPALALAAAALRARAAESEQ